MKQIGGHTNSIRRHTNKLPTIQTTPDMSYRDVKYIVEYRWRDFLDFPPVTLLNVSPVIVDAAQRHEPGSLRLQGPSQRQTDDDLLQNITPHLDQY